MQETMCWSCAVPGSGRCSWDRSLTPVEGWTAQPTKTDGFDTYRVIHCPMYRKELPRTAAKPQENETKPEARRPRRLILTDALIEICDGMGMSLAEVSELTGVRSGIIYRRRLKVRKERGS